MFKLMDKKIIAYFLLKTWLILTYVYGNYNTFFGPRREKNCLQGVANNKGADQPAHLRRAIRAFVIRLLGSIVAKLATSQISIF